MYERVIRESQTPEDLAAFLDAVTLRRLWSSLIIPAPARIQWEVRFRSDALPIYVRASDPRVPDPRGFGCLLGCGNSPSLVVKLDHSCTCSDPVGGPLQIGRASDLCTSE